MDYKIRVSWVPGKQQLAADALGCNPVWPGTAENSVEDIDSGYEDAYIVAMNTGRNVCLKMNSATQ